MVRLTEDLGGALHRYGVAAHRLEEALTLVAARLGVRGQFFVTPTAIFASFKAGADPDRVVLVRSRPGEVDLGRLARLEEVIDDLLGGRASPARALRRVAGIVAAPEPYGPLSTTIAFALTSAGATRFFGGGAREIAAALLIGLSIGVLARLFARRPGAARLFEPLAAALATLMAWTAASLAGPVSAELAVLGGLIVLIPGLSLTVAMNELATLNLVSGTARLMGAAMTFLGIGFGVALGTRLADLALPIPVAVDPAGLPEWTLGVALLVTPLALAILLRARPRDAGWVLLGAIVAYLGARMGTRLLGPELGVCLGALMIGLFSNACARHFSRPASVPLVPGILLLVPGSIGFRSVRSLLDQDVIAGMHLAFSMAMVAVGLVTGLLLANILLPPRRSL
jgi:uncharacterized membrane protein YjjP (DUF1212 family)